MLLTIADMLRESSVKSPEFKVALEAIDRETFTECVAALQSRTWSAEDLDTLIGQLGPCRATVLFHEFLGEDAENKRDDRHVLKQKLGPHLEECPRCVLGVLAVDLATFLKSAQRTTEREN